jgi:hypothetical protein
MYIIFFIKVKAELALRTFNANQVIYGANSYVDDDVKYDKDSVGVREVPLISELNTVWSSKENLFPQVSHKDVETYLLTYFFALIIYSINL